MERVQIFRETYGPHVGTAGAVFPRDVLRCRCGSIQRAMGAKSFPCMRCADGTAFAHPATVGPSWLEGIGIGKRPTRRPLLRGCATCGAAVHAPCRSLGRLTTKGTVMGGFHVARRRP
jgi:hypothetical protein